jgi:hypothetical protein
MTAGPAFIRGRGSVVVVVVPTTVMVPAAVVVMTAVVVLTAVVVMTAVVVLTAVVVVPAHPLGLVVDDLARGDVDVQLVPIRAVDQLDLPHVPPRA